jgi:hypothetical protein
LEKLEIEMELSKASPDKALTQRSELSKKSKIVILLTALGIRRQAKLDVEDYLLYASDLESYEMADLENAVGELAKKPRAEGQTAFPDIATILEAVRGAIRARKPPVPTSAEKWAAYVKACIAEGIEAPDPEIAVKIEKLKQRISL